VNQTPIKHPTPWFLRSLARQAWIEDANGATVCTISDTETMQCIVDAVNEIGRRGGIAEAQRDVLRNCLGIPSQEAQS